MGEKELQEKIVELKKQVDKLKGDKTKKIKESFGEKGTYAKENIVKTEEFSLPVSSEKVKHFVRNTFSNGVVKNYLKKIVKNNKVLFDKKIDTKIEKVG